MAKYRVHLETTASMTITVEVDDDLDEQEAKEAAFDKAFAHAPNDVCAQCSGWGEAWSLDLGEWDASYEGDKEIEPEKVQ